MRTSNFNIKKCAFFLIVTHLLLFFFDISYASENCGIINYKPKKGEPDVKLVTKDNNEFYIVTSSMKNVFNDNNSIIYKRLNLVNKNKLFHYLVPSNKDEYEVYMDKWICNNITNESNEESLLCCINTDDVEIVKKTETDKLISKKITEIKTDEIKPDKDIELLSSLNFDNAFADEIDFVKNFIKLNPKSIPAHEYLYSLYKMNGMLEEADEIDDLIRDLKFNNFD